MESSRSFWEICSSSVQATDLEHTPRVPVAWENHRLIIIMTHITITTLYPVLSMDQAVFI